MLDEQCEVTIPGTMKNDKPFNVPLETESQQASRRGGQELEEKFLDTLYALGVESVDLSTDSALLLQAEPLGARGIHLRRDDDLHVVVHGSTAHGPSHAFGLSLIEAEANAERQHEAVGNSGSGGDGHDSTPY